jgi:D-lactate dehydrogenase (cytochrome)
MKMPTALVDNERYKLMPFPTQDFTGLLGERYSEAASITEQYRPLEGHLYSQVPKAVAQPKSEDEVIAIHKICSAHLIPIVPFGSGSSVEGQAAAVAHGLTLDLRRMDKVIEINIEDMTATVEAGVTRLQLDRALNGTGLFFPVDPGADATIGGMAATRASGTNAVRYGTMRENTLAMSAVLASGEILDVGTTVRKASNGYDLVRLFVGSEGTLGTFTKLSVRLQARPETSAVAVIPFDSVAKAVAFAVAVLQCGLSVARIELFDERTIAALNKFVGMSLREVPTIFMELHGLIGTIDKQRGVITELAGVDEIEFGSTREEIDRLWGACHKRYYACRALRPGCDAFATDVCVPISRLTQVIEDTLADIRALPIPATLHGHIGDGNFHTVVLVDSKIESELKIFENYSSRLVKRAQAAGGTCSGEHGIGLAKKQYLAAEHGASLDWMRNIKRLFDPNNLMNPGKGISLD